MAALETDGMKTRHRNEWLGWALLCTSVYGVMRLLQDLVG
jgi:hypothetical protein